MQWFLVLLSIMLAAYFWWLCQAVIFGFPNNVKAQQKENTKILFELFRVHAPPKLKGLTLCRPFDARLFFVNLLEFFSVVMSTNRHYNGYRTFQWNNGQWKLCKCNESCMEKTQFSLCSNRIKNVSYYSPWFMGFSFSFCILYGISQILLQFVVLQLCFKTIEF